MKKLTAKDFKRYIEVADRSARPDNWDIDKLVIQAFKETGAFTRFTGHFAAAFMLMGADSAFVSTWMTAFQMGREFESRRKEESELKKMTRL